MTQEQKAKAYDEALKAAIAAYKDEDKHLKATLERIFPELKESEDERTRKEIKKLVQCMHDADPRKRRWIAWLEKQGGEQKPIVIIPKFRVGDEIKTSNEESLTITKIDEKGYWSNDLFICDFDDENIWNLVKPYGQREECLDCQFNYAGECKGSCDIKRSEQKPAEWHREDEQNLNACLGYISDEFLRRWLTDIIHVKYDKPADKIELAKSESEEELSDFEAALFSAFSDGWQQYLNGEEVDVAQWAKEHSAELLEAAKQNHAAWSEKDESMYTRTLGILGKCYMGQLPTKVEEELNWFKTLKERIGG